MKNGTLNPLYNSKTRAASVTTFKNNHIIRTKQRVKLILPNRFHKRHASCEALFKNRSLPMRIIRLNLLKQVTATIKSKCRKDVDDILLRRDSHILAVFNECCAYDSTKEFLHKYYKAKDSLVWLKKLKFHKISKPSLYLHNEYETVQRGEYKKAKARVMKQLTFHTNSAKKLTTNAKFEKARPVISVGEKLHSRKSNQGKIMELRQCRSSDGRSPRKPQAKIPRTPFINNKAADRPLTCGVFLCTPKSQLKSKDTMYFSKCVPTKLVKEPHHEQKHINNAYWGIVELINSQRDCTIDKMLGTSGCALSTRDTAKQKPIRVLSTKKLRLKSTSPFKKIQRICTPQGRIKADTRTYTINNIELQKRKGKEQKIRSRVFKTLATLFKPLGKQKIIKNINLVKAYKPF